MRGERLDTHQVHLCHRLLAVAGMPRPPDGEAGGFLHRLDVAPEAGEVVPGTPASAPVEPMIRRKLIWVTAATFLIWAAVCAVIIWGGISVRDLDVFHRMGPNTGS